MAESGLRVLAVAYQTGSHDKKTINDSDLKDLIFIGLIGISDPIRPDVPQTIEKCRNAHIRVIMMTGDHADTARGIGKTIGLDVSPNSVINGETLSKMTDDELDTALKTASIFARINPSDKIRIVLALKRLGEVVAVTGDGVNDAPAIKGANIGIAVGSGTDVAKETADLILLDDNFSTIVSSIEEGRRMYQNIKKVILYLFSGSFAEIILIVGSILAKLPLPVLPAQILWVNIIQETFPTIALAFDKSEKENMNEPPRKRNSQLIDREMRVMITALSFVANGLLLGLFFFIFKTTNNLAMSRTMMFAGLAIASLFYIYSIRSLRYQLWQKNPFDNWHLNAAVLFGCLLFLGAIYLPSLQKLLQTVPLDSNAWLLLGIFGVVNVVIIELIKGLFIKKPYGIQHAN
jgi:Ca2+-transporting ATPase